MSEPRSIITDYLEYCLICGRRRDDIHHVFGGVSKRHIADDDCVVMPLCIMHHNHSGMSVHQNKEMKILSHIIGELAWERQALAEKLAKCEHSAPEELINDIKTEFRKRYGQNYC
jgi:hypothetical protein